MPGWRYQSSSSNPDGRLPDLPIEWAELMTDLEELSPQGQRFLSVIMRSAERELHLERLPVDRLRRALEGRAVGARDVDGDVLARADGGDAGDREISRLAHGHPD